MASASCDRPKGKKTGSLQMYADSFNNSFKDATLISKQDNAIIVQLKIPAGEDNEFNKDATT
jgi:hypothetical protein